MIIEIRSDHTTTRLQWLWPTTFDFGLWFSSVFTVHRCVCCKSNINFLLRMREQNVMASTPRAFVWGKTDCPIALLCSKQTRAREGCIPNGTASKRVDHRIKCFAKGVVEMSLKNVHWNESWLCPKLRRHSVEMKASNFCNSFKTINYQDMWITFPKKMFWWFTVIIIICFCLKIGTQRTALC